MHVHMYIHRFCSHEKKKEQPYYKASELLPQETIALLMKIEVLAWVPHPVDLLACVCMTFML